MPVDTCITNVGEYYSSHYLDSTFTKDVKELVQRWNADGSQSPSRQLHSLAQHYFRAKTQALDEEQLERRNLAGEDIKSWHARLLQALGYSDLQPQSLVVEGGTAVVPILGRVNRYNKPWLVICETHFCLPDGSLKEGMPSEDPLGMQPVLVQQQREHDLQLCEGDWSQCIGCIFTEEDAPRWLLFLAGSQVLLLDSKTYSQGRYLAFDLDDAFGRRERETFAHLAAFLSAETLCPNGESDSVLHDKLEEQSHRFAHGVTESLQFAVREAIELLVNEWAYDRSERQKRPLLRLRLDELRASGKPIAVNLPQLDDGSYEITAEHLKHEALVFVYRLLFCFYAEARGGELEILPIDEDTYRLGYSLESLRDLEHVPLTAATENGTYFHEHLKKLFQLIHQGFHPRLDYANPTLDLSTETVRTFTLRPLTATLFAPESTPLLNRARLSNRCLQSIIRRLSLSTDEHSRTIGRVNYAELGINQLGAVYEGLLSYKGMFADQDLIHVKSADKDFRDKKTPTWFVPKERLEEFKKDEVERLPDGKARIYTRGTFILHLSGIDREQSASYYTPEVLTRCLVEEALRELLKDYGPDDADRILDLKICEPAMGSGAFLNEAAQQLAHHYLELKQKQLGQTIDPAQYGDELRRVKHYITTRNVYGVDLNATAVELGALSLWLGSIHRLLQSKAENGGRDVYQPGATPWFGLRLRCGNSLIGARRAVWTTTQLEQGKHGGKDSETPSLLKPGEQRGANEIYHFLVFDEDMVPTHTDRLLRDFWPERCAAAKKWVTQQVKPKWKPEEVHEALEICELIDQHWQQYAEQRASALAATACTATVWPTASESAEAIAPGPTLEQQERIKAELESTSGSFQRLKLVMDAWCAFWFWPLERVSDLPSREGFLASIRLLLGAEPPNTGLRSLLSARLGFQIDALLAASEGKVPNTTILVDAVPWFDETYRLAEEQNFQHWELIYVEILGPVPVHRGFALIIGNPPWSRPRWEDSTVLAEFEPRLGVREARNAEYNNIRHKLLGKSVYQDKYVAEQRKSIGQLSFLASERTYSELKGSEVNVCKNFVALTWNLLSLNGCGGLVHEDGGFSDPRDRCFRKHYYPRLRTHFHFKNEWPLFQDVDHHKPFSLNIFGKKYSSVSFDYVANLIHPKTVLASRIMEQEKREVPGVKTENGRWDLRGHVDRLLHIREEELSLFAHLLDNDTTPTLEARLPNVHSVQLLHVLKKFTQSKMRFSDMSDQWKSDFIFHESYAQHDQIIERHSNPTAEISQVEDWVISGPHFYVGTPFAKTPRTQCLTKNDWEEIDLETIEDEFLPRSLYVPNNKAKFSDAIPSWSPTGVSHPITKYYRHINRAMCRPDNERSLIASIIPPGATAINASLVLTFTDLKDLVAFTGSCCSLPFDFLLRASGRTHAYSSDLRMFPVIEEPHQKPLIHRMLRLSCLTRHYAKLWQELADSEILNERWTSDDPRLCSHAVNWKDLNSNRWDRSFSLRTNFARRQALLEIDVLCAMALKITLEELLVVYRVQFSVLQQYESNDLYDNYGRRIPSTTRKNPGGKQFSEAFREWQAEGNNPLDPKAPPLTVSWEIDNGLQTITKTFYPPFTKVDREADYARAYEVFQQRYGVQR